jgi:hypothetical protein
MKISYQKHWGPDGTAYTQRIRMSGEEYSRLYDAFSAEIARGLPRKDEYINTSDYEVFMRHPAIQFGLVYLNLTQTRFANLFLKLPLKDRNTYIKIG